MRSLRDFFEAVLAVLELHVRRFRERMLALLVVAGVAAGVVYLLFLAPPKNFPTGNLILVSYGETLPDIARIFGEQQVVAYPTLLVALVRLTGNAEAVPAGVYRFETPLSVFGVAARLTKGETGVPAIRIRFGEGQTAREMSVAAAKVFPAITQEEFLRAAEPYEGYLFPDTYVFQPNATAETIVARLRENFDTRIASVTPSIMRSEHTLAEVVSMASIIEKEVRTLEEKKMISGILWNRIARGMPLQVDAVFGYINSRGIYAPSFEDLAVDSPYNTYLYKGLPPGPIGNPGLDSLYAAANPTPSKYLFYLTGRDGQTRYATTFAEHKKNRAWYLD